MPDINIGQEIIDGCKQKNKQSQEDLYKACYVPFMKIGLRYAPSYEDAAEILNDTFLKIFTKIDSYTGNGNFIGWMRRILVNTAIDRIRQQKEETHVNIEDVSHKTEQHEETKFVIDEKQLLSAIRSLPAMHSKVFNLYAMEEYSHKEIADMLGITLELSRYYLFNARKMLQEKVAPLLNE